MIIKLPILSILVTMITGCSGITKSNDVRSFIPGIYTRKVSNEFSTGRDTLLISELSKTGNSYRIIHRSSFQKLHDGKTTRAEGKQEIWNAVYNEQEKLLHETVKGKLISFNPEGKTLFVGTSEYKKVGKVNLQIQK